MTLDQGSGCDGPASALEGGAAGFDCTGGEGAEQGPPSANNTTAQISAAKAKARDMADTFAGCKELAQNLLVLSAEERHKILREVLDQSRQRLAVAQGRAPAIANPRPKKDNSKRASNLAKKRHQGSLSGAKGAAKKAKKNSSHGPSTDCSS